MNPMDGPPDNTEPNAQPQPTRARCEVADLGIAPQQCISPQRLDPCTLVIFGASGDLTVRKLIPALFNLWRNGGLPNSFRIVGCARTEMSGAEFRAKLEEQLITDDPSLASQWKEFAPLIHYRSLDYENVTSFAALAGYLNQLENDQKTERNKVFYLAVPPMLCATVAANLGKAGLAPDEQNGGEDQAFARRCDLAPG